MLQNPMEWRKLVREYATLRDLKDGMTPQARGQRFNGMIAELLKAFDIDATPNQRSVGELDVTFAHGGRRFILEAKWEQRKIGTGPIAKLQRRVEQRMAGVTGVFLSMKGYSDEALAEVDKGRRLDVLLLDQEHWEAMLTGFVPPQELVDLVTDAASFQGRAYTPLSVLFDRRAAIPEITFGSAPALGDEPVRSSGEDVRGKVVLAGVDARQVGVAVVDADTLLLTVDQGVLAVNIHQGTSSWAVPVAGCSNSPLPLSDGSVLVCRAHGIARYHSGKLSAFSSGCTEAGSGELLMNPDGSAWCFDRSWVNGTNGSHATLIRLGDRAGDEGWAELPYPAATATAAAWLSQTEVVVAGNSGLLVSPISSKTERRIPLPGTYPVAVCRVDDRRFLIVYEDLSVRLADAGTGAQRTLGQLHGVARAACRMACGMGGSTFLASRYQAEDGRDLVAVIQIDLLDEPAQTAARAKVNGASTKTRTKPEAASQDQKQGVETDSAAPTSTPPVLRQASVDPVEARFAEQRRGYNDGLSAAATLPLYGFEGLLAANFDIVQWLEQWRETWRLIAIGQAQPGMTLPDWLRALARFLGTYAAPPGVIDGYFTPSPAYVTGFADGMRAAWTAALVNNLVPRDPVARANWLREPALGSSAPWSAGHHLLTIENLRVQAERAQRAATLRRVGRVALWLLTVLFGIFEIGAIGVTATNGWPEHNVANAVIGNLCYAIPFVVLLWFLVRDTRRRRKQRRDE